MKSLAYISILLFSQISLAQPLRVVTCSTVHSGGTSTSEFVAGTVSATLDYDKGTKTMFHSAGTNLLGWLIGEGEKNPGKSFMIERTEESPDVMTFLTADSGFGELTNVKSAVWFMDLSLEFEFGPFSCKAL